MHINKRARRWTLGLAMTAVALALCVRLLPHEQLLMDRARRITRVTNGDRSPCMWLSDHDAILMSYRPEGDRFEFKRLDADTGRQTPVEAPNRTYRSMLQAYTATDLIVLPDRTVAQETFHAPPDGSLSLDHKWLTFSPTVTNWTVPKPTTYIATTLDGKQEVRWRSAEISDDPRWLHDKHQWIEPVQNTGNQWFLAGVILHDMNDLKQARHLQFRGVKPGERLVGITQGDRLLQADWSFGSPNMSVQMVDYGILPGSIARHSYRIRLPKSAYVREVALSPRGDRLAWLFVSDDLQPLVVFLHRLFASVPQHPRRTVGLWVSNLDGSGMMEVGHRLALPSKKRMEDASDLQWLPGGKRLSFIYQNALYVVDIP